MERYRQFLAILAVLILFTNLAVYLSLPEVASFPPVYFIVGFAVLAGPLCFSRESFGDLRKSPIVVWCYGFILVSAVWLLFQRIPSETAWQGFRTRILSVFVILILLCVFRKPEAQLWARRAVFIAVIFAVGINAYELLNPLAFSMVQGRSAGLYYNPNQCGAALVLGMIFSVGLLRERYRLLFLFTVGIATFLTLSRGAILGWFATSVFMIARGQVSLRRSLLIGCSVFALIIIIAASQWDSFQYQLMDLGVLNKDVSQRIESFVNPQDFATDDSAAQRAAVFGGAWQMFASNPIFGYGVGASREWEYEISSHNQYLNLMVDHGALGFFILPLIVLATVWRSQGEARQVGSSFVAFIICWGFFSHNVLEEYYILLTFSLLASMSLASRTTPVNQLSGSDVPGRRVFASQEARTRTTSGVRGYLAHGLFRTPRRSN